MPNSSAACPVRRADRLVGGLILLAWCAAGSLGLLSWLEPDWYLRWMHAGRHSEALDYKGLGDHALRARNWAQAVTAYRQALAVEPELADASGNLAIALSRLGRLDEAEHLLRRMLASQPGQTEVTAMQLGELGERRGRPQEAIRWYLLSADSAAYPADAWTRAGGLLLRQGRPVEARLHLEAAGKAFASFEGLLAGMLEERVPRRDERRDLPLVRLRERGIDPPAMKPFAAWVFEWTAGRDRRHAQCQLWLAEACRRTGDLAAARSACGRALQMRPGWSEALACQQALSLEEAPDLAVER